MATLYHLAWREYPTLALAILGLALLARAVRNARIAARHRRVGTDAHSLALMRAFRGAVIGLALAGVAAGWQWHIPWLLAVAVVVGMGETVESSADVVALEQAERLPRHRVPTKRGA